MVRKERCKVGRESNSSWAWLLKVGHYEDYDWCRIDKDEEGYLVESRQGRDSWDKAHFRDLKPEDQALAKAWIKYNIIPRKTRLCNHTSYGMKHILEDRTKIYMTNNQFKELMLDCGFNPYDPADNANWEFYISKQSPIFQRQTDGKLGLPVIRGDSDA